MKLYQYIYYGIYRLLLRTSLGDVAEYLAAVWLAVLAGLNLIVMLSFTGIDLRAVASVETRSSMLFGELLILNYVLFIRKRNYETIIASNADETCRQKKIRRLVSLSYIVLSLAALFVA